MLTTKPYGDHRIALTVDDSKEVRRRQELLARVREGDRWAGRYMERFYGLKHWHTRDGIILGGKSKTCPHCVSKWMMARRSGG